MRPILTSRDRATAGVVFHLREISSGREYGNTCLWMFGNTLSRHSVAVKVTGFRPYFFVDAVEGMDSNKWMGKINEDIKSEDDRVKESPILSVVLVSRSPVVGFCDGKSRNLFRLTLFDSWHMKLLCEYFQNSKVRTYHANWKIESLFLHQSGLELQTWISVNRSEIIRKPETSCAIERLIRCDAGADIAKDLSHCPEVDCVVPPILCCALRIRVISSNAREVGSAVYQPKARNPKDIVVAVHTTLYWLGHPEEKAMHRTFAVGGTQRSSNVLAALGSYVHKQHDVDCFVMLSDNYSPTPLHYIARRAHRFPFSKVNRTPHRITQKDFLSHPGRTRFDVRDNLVKMFINPKLEGFSLRLAVQHPKLVKPVVDPSAWKSASVSSSLTAEENADACRVECRLLAKLEQQSNMIIGMLAISCSSSTPLQVAVSNGQQIRVWNKLTRKFHEEKLLINAEKLALPPLIVKKRTIDSSFPDPPSLPNVPIARPKEDAPAKKRRKTGQKSKTFALFGNAPVSFEEFQKAKRKKKAKSKKRYTGGFVCEPERGVYDENPVMTLDFASLYPSIIRGYRICYRRVLFQGDEEYLDELKYVLQFIPINEEECMVLVAGTRTADGGMVPAPTILPKTIDEVAQERSKVRKRMKTVTDSRLLDVLNARQLGCKVYQNAVYGFLGVEKNAKMACPILAAAVCRLGRWMIHTVIHIVKKEYKAFLVYGDTDSVMIQLPTPPKLALDQKYEYLYKKCYEIEERFLSVFPSPNKLEFECMKKVSEMYDPKNYAALECGPKLGDWKKEPKRCIKGLAYKKRDRCPLVRRVGDRTTDLILHGNAKQVPDLWRKELTPLVSGAAPIEDLVITRLLKRQDEYKSGGLIQVITAKRIGDRRGHPCEAGTRLAYVVLKGSEKLMHRGEDPEHARTNRLPLDYTYYLEKQVLPAITPLMRHHKDVDIDTTVTELRETLFRNQNRIRSLFPTSSSSSSAPSVH